MHKRDKSPQRKRVDESHLFAICDEYDRLVCKGEKENNTFWPFRELDNHLIHYWYDLNIKGPVSEPLRRRLFALHATQDKMCMVDTKMTRPTDRWLRTRTELSSMYWLMPPEHRKTFFHHSIMNSIHLVDYYFTADPVLALIEPSDNQGLRLWALMKKGDLRQNTETYAMIHEAQLEFEKTHPLIPFCTRISRLLWQKEIHWFRGYVAFVLDCPLSVWTPLSSALINNLPPTD